MILHIDKIPMPNGSPTDPPYEASLQTLVIRFDWRRESEYEVHIGRIKSPFSKSEAIEHEWTQLDFYQCPTCPLNALATLRCPAAVSIASVMHIFADCDSYEGTTITAIDQFGRRTELKSTAAHAAYFIMRSVLYSGGCPITAQVEPLLADLRPLATESELVRHLILKVLVAFGGDKKEAQRCVHRLSESLYTVYRYLGKRVTAIVLGDAIINSLALSDIMLKIADISFEEIYRQVELETEALAGMEDDK